MLLKFLDRREKAETDKVEAELEMTVERRYARCGVAFLPKKCLKCERHVWLERVFWIWGQYGVCRPGAFHGIYTHGHYCQRCFGSIGEFALAAEKHEIPVRRETYSHFPDMEAPY